VANKNCFFSNGLKFECVKNCSKCCRLAGVVYIYNEEVKRISTYLKISTDEFIKEYCMIINKGLCLKDQPNSTNCIFLIPDNKCFIYPVRPYQCFSYPFWSNILLSEERWINESKFCPGIGQGKFYSYNEILTLIKNHPQSLSFTQ
jgi:Fe-S-cluster containining protein